MARRGQRGLAPRRRRKSLPLGSKLCQDNFCTFLRVRCSRFKLDPGETPKSSPLSQGVPTKNRSPRRQDKNERNGSKCSNWKISSKFSPRKEETCLEEIFSRTGSFEKQGSAPPPWENPSRVRLCLPALALLTERFQHLFCSLGPVSHRMRHELRQHVGVQI